MSSAAGLHPRQLPQWEYLLSYFYDTNKNWGDNRTSLQPGIFRQLLDSGLIQLLTTIMEDHRVEALSGDTGLQWPPNDTTRGTLVSTVMHLERRCCPTLRLGNYLDVYRTHHLHRSPPIEHLHAPRPGEVRCCQSASHSSMRGFSSQTICALSSGSNRGSRHKTAP